MHRLFAAILIAGHGAAAFSAPNLAISTKPYATGGFFTNPLLPLEGQDVKITVRAECTGRPPKKIPANLRVIGRDGKTAATESLVLKRDGNMAEASWTWPSERNGLFTARVELDPADKIAEDNEDDNTAELVLPVVVRGRAMHFAWYKCVPGSRWATCVTSTREGEFEALAERGVLPLKWAYGGMSWSY